MEYSAIAALAAATVIVFMLTKLSIKTSTPLPPGPARDPLIGNLRNFPRNEFPRVFSKWKALYGDVVYTNVLGMSSIVLNSRKAIDDLMVERAPRYQGRPLMYMMSKHSGWEWAPAIKSGGSELVEDRKVLLSGLGPSTVKQWYPTIERTLAEFVNRLAKSRGEDIRETLKNHVGSVVLRIAYGEDIYNVYGERLVRSNVEGLNINNYIMSNFWIIDILPILRYLPRWTPGITFHEMADKSRHYSYEIKDWPFKLVTEETQTGTVHPSFTRQSLEDGHDPARVKDAVGIFYAAGLDTTFIVLCTFVLAMLLHPEKQREAQSIIDAFISIEGRLPTFSDRDKLKYIDDFIKELLRWNPPLPLVIPHANAEEDIYQGMRIPKGSTIFPNVWHLMHDEQIWDNPAEFNPKRFAKDDARRLPDPSQYIFGFGRRICPGKHLADRILFLTLINLLAFFTFELAPGEPTPLKPQFDTGFFSHPILPRVRLLTRNETLMPMA